MLQRDGADRAVDPLAPKTPHFKPKAKSVIWLFHGRRPESRRPVRPEARCARSWRASRCRHRSAKSITAMGTAANTLMPSQRTGSSTARAASGFPTGIRNRAARRRDDRHPSCWADGLNHVGSVCQMNTGSILAGRPSLGAWVIYGLGIGESEPADVCCADRRQRSRRRAEELELRISAGDLSGHAVPQHGRADSRSEPPRRSATNSSAAGWIC